MKTDQLLYLSSITYNYYQQDFWESLRPEVSDGGRFFLDLSMYYKPQRFVSRNGEWSLPWPQIVPPGFEMPEYDAAFSKDFFEASDLRAQDIAALIENKNQKFAVMYSGGFDSTVVMVSLIKNLTPKQLENIAVCANSHSMIENPDFWKKYIWGKFKIFDSSNFKYDDLIERGYRPISADDGDSIFGTMGFLELQQNYDYYISDFSPARKAKLSAMRLKLTDGDTHYSEFKDLLCRHWSIPTNPKLGEEFYDKFDKNIKTATVPIHSVHDFYWWVLFNLKWVNCSLRVAVYLNDRANYGDVINNWVVNWFSSKSYQQWSMVNNNNGQKIEYEGSTYKMAAREYIYDFDKNEWYYYFKLKLGSLGPNVMYQQEVEHLPIEQRPNARFGIDSDYNLLLIDDADVQQYIRHHMTNFKRDW